MTKTSSNLDARAGSDAGDGSGPRAPSQTSPQPLRVTRVGATVIVSAPIIPLPRVLSESERAVAQAVLAGSTNAEIAKARGTSTKTVANQLNAIYRKIGVRSRDELASTLVTGQYTGRRN